MLNAPTLGAASYEWQSENKQASGSDLKLNELMAVLPVVCTLPVLGSATSTFKREFVFVRSKCSRYQPDKHDTCVYCLFTNVAGCRKGRDHPGSGCSDEFASSPVATLGDPSRSVRLAGRLTDLRCRKRIMLSYIFDVILSSDY